LNFSRKCPYAAATVTKRKFLAILSGAVAGLVGLPLLRRYDWSAALLPEVPSSAAKGVLKPAESAILLAYAEALADDRDFSDETRQYMKTHLDRRTENDAGYLALYEMTAAFLTKLGDFAKLTRAQRVALLEQHGMMSCRVHRRECLSPFGRSKRMIRAFAASDLVSSYYMSAAGWAVVGYSVFPGGCGDLRRYTQPEEMHG
jgi:hypothetical protein